MKGSSNFDLLTTVEQGGCSAKIPAQELSNILSNINFGTDPNLLVGTETSDDASVWKLNSDTAIIQTTDFFPPVCSDPYEFGEIAAANALSDIFAMGGDAISALNLVMFPSKTIDTGVLKEILEGGASKVIEAGAVLTGGHSIEDITPKYGLAVTGLVHPDKIIANKNAKSGDLLILTKPIGTGIILAAHRLENVSKSDHQQALDNMKLLNKAASKIMQKYDVRAATDVTGFGLAGHALEMAVGADVTLVIKSKNVPILDGAYELAEMSCLPCALFNNMKYVENKFTTLNSMDHNLKMIMFDAQTSGGLLMSVPAAFAKNILAELNQQGLTKSSIIGEVRDHITGSFLIIE